MSERHFRFKRKQNSKSLQTSTRTPTAAFVIGLILTAAVAAATAMDSNEVSPKMSSSTAISALIDGLKVSDLRDSFNELHNGHRHEAIDIMRPHGTPVHAVIRGTIRRIFHSRAGGNTIYEFDDNSEYCYYYAHLDKYAGHLYEGEHVSKGDVLGYVGTSGDAAPNAPHLHFAIFRVGADKFWWKGIPIDPYPILVHSIDNKPST